MRSFVVGLTAVVLLAISAAPVSASSWHGTTQFAPGGLLAGSDSVAASESTVHLVSTRSGVRYRRSLDGGRIFGAERAIVTDTLPANQYTALSVAAEGSVVAILYSRLQPGGVRTLLLRVSHDSGTTWRAGPTIATSQSKYGRGDGSVAISFGIVVVAWTDPASGDVLLDRIVLDVHGPAVRLGTTTSRHPLNTAVRFGEATVVASGTRVMVFWSPGSAATTDPAGIVGVRSRDRGMTFAPLQTIADTPFGNGADGPVAAAANGAVVLVASSTAVFRSTNGGLTFRPIAGLVPSNRGAHVYDVHLGPAARADVIVESGGYLAHSSSDDGGSHWKNGKSAAGPQEASYDGVNLVVSGTTTTVAWDRGDRTGPIFARSNW